MLFKKAKTIAGRLDFNTRLEMKIKVGDWIECKTYIGEVIRITKRYYIVQNLFMDMTDKWLKRDCKFYF